jgi:hypothetical protein
MPFDLDELRIEKVNLEIGYHSTYTFFGLKGVIAERWAHGPIFGAVGESGSGQLNLTPASEPDVDERIVGVIGIQTSAFLAEGPHWTSDAPNVAASWFDDIFTVLKPQRTVYYRAEVLAIYPIRDPYVATRRLAERYYRADALNDLANTDRYIAAVEFMAPEEQPTRSIVMGVLGPPHRRMGYFTFENDERDDEWWLAVRVNLIHRDEDGIDDPLEQLRQALDEGYSEVSRLVRAAFPAIVGD